jgi:membrane fusion protein, multidrug efflux system
MNAHFLKQQRKNLSAVLVVLLAAGCNKPAGNFQMPPPQVDVVTLHAQPLPISIELPGRIDPVRIAQVNARVDGNVLQQEFVQGANVTNGQVLYQIDPAPYQANLDSAKANLLQQQALVERYKPLVSINAVSKQNYDNAVSAAAQAQAAVDIANINLGYCKVVSPIDGRIGAALVTEGALVNLNAATPMALVQQLDPIYFDFTEASKDVLKQQEQLQSGKLVGPSGEAQVTLELPNHTIYPHAGKLLFTDVSVDPSSGMVTLRAEFPNPDHVLLPGMFCVGTLDQGVAPQIILVPQPAVVIGPNGGASVMLITPTNSVEAQPIQLGDAVGTNWVVESGLKEGERVMVNGLQKAYPGMTVNPVAMDGNTNAPAVSQ